MKTKFPYKCAIKETGRKFTPTMIDFDNEQVWWQKSQTSGNGEWIDFRDVNFTKVETFVDLSCNQSISNAPPPISTQEKVKSNADEDYKTMFKILSKKR